MLSSSAHLIRTCFFFVYFSTRAPGFKTSALSESLEQFAKIRLCYSFLILFKIRESSLLSTLFCTLCCFWCGFELYVCGSGRQKRSYFVSLLQQKHYQFFIPMSIFATDLALYPPMFEVLISVCSSRLQ